MPPKKQVATVNRVMGPKTKALKPNHKRVLVLGGGQIGIKTLWALMTYGRFEEFVHTVGVWPDWLNNSATRYLRHYGDEPLTNLPPALVELAQSLPRLHPDKSLAICGRILEQLVMFDYAAQLGFPAAQIVKARYENELLLRYIDQWEIDAVIVAAFGGRINDDVRKRLDNQIWVCHPGFSIDDKCTHLPENCRGAQVFDRIVSSRDCQSLQITMQELVWEWDAGRIAARTPVFGGPHFFEHEMGDRNLSARARKAIEEIAVMFGPLLRYNLLRLLFTVDELVGHFSLQKLVKMGFGHKEITAAQGRKRRRKKD